MDKTINEIIKRAKKKIQHLSTERILCYTVDILGNIISGRTVSKNNQIGYSFLNVTKLLDMFEDNRVHHVILLHNHPRSTMMASEDDDIMTKKVKKICHRYGINLYDHIIIMKDLDEVYSYRTNKRIITVSRKSNKPPVVVMKRSANG